MRAIVVGVALALCAALPASAHPRDLMTPGGRLGNRIHTGETTNADIKEMFGTPTGRKVVRVGCSRVVRLRWHGEIQTYAYRGDPDRFIVDVKVNARTVTARGIGVTYRFHTRKGLRVGDSEERLRELYPRRQPIEEEHHTHYILGEHNGGPKLLGKVKHGVVVQLEAAPYEFC